MRMAWMLILLTGCGVRVTFEPTTPVVDPMQVGNPPEVRHEVGPQPAGIDAPSWPAASTKSPVPHDGSIWQTAQPDHNDSPALSRVAPVQATEDNSSPSTERMAKSHLATGESHSSAGVSSIAANEQEGDASAGVRTGGLWGSTPHAAPVTPTAVSSFPAVPPADAGATLLPVAPRRLLVLFTAPKCKPCDDLKRLLAQCESQVYGDFIFREVDITTFDVGLNSAPWLALFDAGTERQIEGPTAAPKTLGGLKKLLTRWGQL